MKITGFSDCFLLGRLSSDKDALWFQTLPDIGEYPDKEIFVKGKRVRGTIVVDQQAVDSCVASFKAEQSKHGPEWKGVLVDREHFSLMANKESDAMAWAKDIRGGKDGVWTRWEFTEPGKKLWDGKILVSRSPVMELDHIGGNLYRPVAISSIAMTNTPQFETLATFAAARAAGDGTPPGGANNKGDNMDKQLCDALGLPETATVADAIAKINALKGAQQTAEAEMKKATAACTKAKCDAFIAAHKGKIADETKFREAYEKNPEATETAFGVFRSAPEKQPSQTRIVARGAATPEGGHERKPDAQIAAKRMQAVNAHRSANPGMTFSAAWCACRDADPELFADEDAAE